MVNRGWVRSAVDWVSKADGSERIPIRHRGVLYSVLTVPSSQVAPTDNYDVTIETDSDADLMAGACADRDTATAEFVRPSLDVGDGVALVTLHGDEYLRISNAGSGKAGVVILTIGPAAKPVAQ